MLTVKVRDAIDAPADVVFRDVSDFGNLDRLEIVESCTVEGDGVGAIRTVVFADPSLGHVVERLEAWDPKQRTLSYSILNEDCALPVRSYLATVRVYETGPSACMLEWGSSFEPLAAEAELRPMFEGFYSAAIEAAKRSVSP